ncbi:MAG TPA: NADPH-dependent F420 reductase [Candidatus Limnocylindria bacterium]|nr:NADPH-dependent F420 reductase [Candidatus Limnocylindria bacterium]
MRVGVLGTGDVGKAIGRGFITLGHEVKMGSRDGAGKANAWAQAAGPKASAGTFPEAAAFGEVVVLATLGAANESAIQMAEPRNFAGKVVIDTTNPLDFSRGAPPTLLVSRDDSGGEQVQRLLPDAKVVKAFNIVGNAHMFRPDFPGGPPDMLIAGNDPDAKRTVSAILEDFGWPALDLGGIEASRYLEAMCMAWVLYGFKSGSWNHAFKLLRK